MAQEVVTSPPAELVFISLYADGALCVMLDLFMVTFRLLSALKLIRCKLWSYCTFWRLLQRKCRVVTGRLSKAYAV